MAIIGVAAPATQAMAEQAPRALVVVQPVAPADDALVSAASAAVEDFDVVIRCTAFAA